MTDLRITEEAAAVLRQVRAERGGKLSITIDGGCCEGTAPHLYDDYLVPAGSIEIGRFDDIPVYVPGPLRQQYATVCVTLDVVDDALSDALSLETILGKRLTLSQK